LTQTLILYARVCGMVVAAPLVFLSAFLATVVRQPLDAARFVWRSKAAPEPTPEEKVDAKAEKKRKAADKRRTETQQEMRKAEGVRAAARATALAAANKDAADKLEAARTRVIGAIEEEVSDEP